MRVSMNMFVKLCTNKRHLTDSALLSTHPPTTIKLVSNLKLQSHLHRWRSTRTVCHASNAPSANGLLMYPSTVTPLQASTRESPAYSFATFFSFVLPYPKHPLRAAVHACIGLYANQTIMAKARRNRKNNPNQRGGYSGQSLGQSNKNNFAVLAATEQYGECVCLASITRDTVSLLWVLFYTPLIPSDCFYLCRVFTGYSTCVSLTTAQMAKSTPI